MPVDPFIEPLLATLPPFPRDIEDWGAFRSQGISDSDALFAMVGEPGPDMPAPRAVQLDVASGHIDLLIYRPEGDAALPAHLFLHGGGWVAGDIHNAFIDTACRERAVGIGCVVVAVNYRKAPEHPFPVPLEDSLAALRWVVANAEELGVDVDSISLGGQSAGAQLAAAVALRVRDEGGPALRLILLEVPALDLTLTSSSLVDYGSGYGLSTSDIEFLVELYVGDHDRQDPYVSPLLCRDLTGFPPTHVMVAEYDPLRVDGERFVARLQAAGVSATCSTYAGHIHGSSAFTAVMQTARDWRQEALDVLTRAHASAS